MAMIDRNNAQALMPNDVSREILGNVASTSTVMSLARRLPDMTSSQRRQPVWSTLPTAYFVAGDTGRKQTTNVSWENVYINAEELAVIVPIPEAVLDDADYDIWAEARPLIESAFGGAIDAAILYGINSPASWPEGIVEQAETKGHEITQGEVGDLYDDIFAEGGVIAKVEEDGFLVNGHIAAMSLRAKLRSLRDNDDRPLFSQTMQAATEYALDGQPVRFPTNGSIDPTKSLLISGDWDQVVYSMRQDITYKLLTEAVIQDNNGAILYNLAQQDMVALRCVMRLGWQLPNPINLVNKDAATRFPFAFLEPANAS